ncbi:TetR/AcrR family transcriptional regulator [uncultured Friedmanniella sp.]|uniref:TetR/AcrR family transcriptional regulator n=1 Tax=uncultured Friedmanniella sp. TaxID=335381 RepID=UPI0035CA54A4
MSEPAPRPVPAARRRLDRSAVLAAATGLARSGGLDELTMRRLAAELGTAPMSLYRHVADRQDLLQGMLDAVAQGIVLPSAHDDPRSELTAVLTAAHEAFRRDPWVVPLIAVDGLASPEILPTVERVLAALSRSGLPDDELIGAYVLLWQYLYGENLASRGAGADNEARRVARLASEEAFPVLRRLVARSGPAAATDFFELNLQRVLDAILSSPSQLPLASSP